MHFQKGPSFSLCPGKLCLKTFQKISDIILLKDEYRKTNSEYTILVITILHLEKIFQYLLNMFTEGVYFLT